MSADPQLHLHPDAVRHNLAALRQHLKPHTTRPHRPRLWAVVKADAYGHGLRGMLSGFQNADGLAVTSLNDAYACRAAGWSGPILHLGSSDTITALNDPDLAPLHVVISRTAQIAQLETASGFNDLHVWLRFSGALNHSGLKGAEYVHAYHRLSPLRELGKIAALGHLQHYAHAEDTKHLHYERQLFGTLIKGLPGPICTENSAAVLNSPEFGATTTWVRSGIALYGVNPLGTHHDPGFALQPAMTLRAPIYATQNLEPGDSLGYGSAFRAPRAMRVGLVRCGYADGYPRQISQYCPCSIAGRPATLVGRVSMDTLSVDITGYADVNVGSIVSLWGEHGVSAERVADAANTIAAQLFTGITKQVSRYYPGDRGYQTPQA